MITRSQWGARPAKSSTAIGTVLGWAVHWEGPKLGTFAHSACANKVRGIQTYHMDHNKWADIAYNFVICPHGETYEGRGFGKRSAANGTNDSNEHYLAVCYLGGEGDPFSLEAQIAFAALMQGAKARPHSTFFNTACPGPEIRTWVDKFNKGEIKMDGDVLTAPLAGNGIYAHPSGEGYYLLAVDGGVFGFGKAPFFGSMGGKKLAAPIKGMTVTPSGKGYWLVGEDGGVFAFGDAFYYGRVVVK